MSPAELIRSTRLEAGLTQVDLARRMGISQAAVARLEKHGANPTVATLERAVGAAGARLSMSAEPGLPEVNEQQILRHVRMTPAERLAAHQAAYVNIAKLRNAAR